MRPSGVIAIATGEAPTLIGRPRFPDAVSTGKTLSEPVDTTYAVAPSGETAIAAGCDPTLTGNPASRVTVFTGETRPGLPSTM